MGLVVDPEFQRVDRQHKMGVLAYYLTYFCQRLHDKWKKNGLKGGARDEQPLSSATEDTCNPMFSRAPSISSKHLIVLMFLRVIPKKTKRTDTLLQEYALCNRLKYVVIWRIDFFYSEIYFIRTKHILILQFALRDAHRCSLPSGGGVADIWFCQIFQKPAWNRENFGP